MKTMSCAFALLLATSTAASAQSGVELGADLGLGLLFGNGSTVFQASTPTSLRAGFLVSEKMQLEPRVNLVLLSGSGSTITSLSATPALMFRLKGTRSDGMYFAALPGLDLVSGGGNTATQFSLGGGIGIRIPQGERLGFRIEGQYVHSFENDDFTGIDSIRALFGVSFFTH
jgi:hypothetical protein